jgi:1-acyl-sn-glycerol-3-phosphate acyltransferase
LLSKCSAPDYSECSLPVLISSRLLLCLIAVLLWFAESWAVIKMHFYGDEQTLKQLGKKRAVALSTHGSDVDWLLGWLIADKANCLGVRINTDCLISEILLLAWTCKDSRINVVSAVMRCAVCSFSTPSAS